VRLFLALELPASLRDRLAALQSRLRPTSAGWRWVRPEGIHLTLRFLGEVEAQQDSACRSAWRDAVRPLPPFRFSVEGIGRFPPAGRPRVLWVGVREEGSAGVLQALVGRLERAARECGFPPERRRFSPHLTLARAARGGRPEWHGGAKESLGERVEVDRVLLFLSELRPSGARYTALDSFDLQGSPEQA
jgi:2'-5' RNA ligase